MSMENLDKKWDELEAQIYYWDGSWRDLYVQDTNNEDWKK